MPEKDAPKKPGIFQGFFKKPGTQLTGGGPPLPSPVANPIDVASKTEIPDPAAEVAKARNEADNAFSPFMDELEDLQNPKAPFLIKFGTRKGGLHKRSFGPILPSLNDSRVLLLIAPDDVGSFTVITRQEAKEIKSNSPKVHLSSDTQSVQAIIDRCLKDGEGDFGGGFWLNQETKINQVNLGYLFGDKDHARISYDSSALSSSSTEAVLASIQRSRDLAAKLEEEKQRPLKEATTLARERTIMANKLSESLKKPFVPSTGKDIGAPPSSFPTV